jgi:macrolide-specific efflux system membrane fusion protein
MNSVLGVVLVAAAAGAYAAVNSGSTAKAPTGSRMVSVAKGTVLATVSGSGSLVSPSDAGADFTTGGTLTEVRVKPGDKVTKGQVLAKVSKTTVNQTLTEQEASLTAAEASLTKAEEGQTPASSQTSPSPSASVDASAVAQAEAQVAQAQDAVNTAQQAVDGTTLKAPVSGTVASVAAAVGQTVSGTSGSGSSNSSSSSSSSSSTSTSSSSSPTGFVVITNPKGMQVTADFSESDALKLKEGQAATVTLNAQSNKALNAKVLSVSSLPATSTSSSGGSGSSTAVQYAATLAVNGSTTGLRTGMSASIQVVTGEVSNALYVSSAAVTGTGTNRTVTVVKSDGSTQVVNVTVGLQGDTNDEITSGLTQGEQVRINSVASTGTNGFPGGGFPGGGAGRAGGGAGGAGGAVGGGGGGRG